MFARGRQFPLSSYGWLVGFVVFWIAVLLFQFRPASVSLGIKYKSKDLEDRFNQPNRFSQLLYVANRTALICRLPKVASTAQMMLIRRMNGAPNWNSTLNSEIRDRAGRTSNKVKKWKEVLNPAIKKMVVVRNPVNRLLSGYLDKILKSNRLSMLPKSNGTTVTETPSFEEFVDILDSVPIDTVDKHFRPQVTLCRMNEIPYDMVVKYEDRQTGVRKFLESIGMWEEFGKDGWGPHGTSAFFEKTESIVMDYGPRDLAITEEKDLSEYYTAELLERVFRLYEKDFLAMEHLGYTREVGDYI
ncbi:hypothetical protein BSKO_05874 [Bryopsis sp. KO-2023]|nr:hypothetical protein BSKO_05874 [Bryopsis sp. KO-2023]